MKHLIVFALIISIQSDFATARTDDPGNNCGSKGIPDQGEVNAVEKLTNGLERENLKKLSSSLCGQLQLAYSTDMTPKQIDTSIENLILQHINTTRRSEDYQKRITTFWNRKAQFLICTVKTPVSRSPQHFLKRAIDFNLHRGVFNKFLYKNRKLLRKTVNHIELYNGKRETILDYVENILNSKDQNQYDIGELLVIQTTLKKYFGALNAVKIPKLIKCS